MVTGLFFVLAGGVILIYPEILAILFALFLVLFGLGMMAAAWQFRRMKRQSQSPFVNWIIRY